MPNKANIKSGGRSEEGFTPSEEEKGGSVSGSRDKSLPEAEEIEASSEPVEGEEEKGEANEMSKCHIRYAPH